MIIFYDLNFIISIILQVYVEKQNQ